MNLGKYKGKTITESLSKPTNWLILNQSEAESVESGRYKNVALWTSTITLYCRPGMWRISFVPFTC